MILHCFELRNINTHSTPYPLLQAITENTFSTNWCYHHSFCTSGCSNRQWNLEAISWAWDNWWIDASSLGMINRSLLLPILLLLRFLLLFLNLGVADPPLPYVFCLFLLWCKKLLLEAQSFFYCKDHDEWCCQGNSARSSASERVWTGRDHVWCLSEMRNKTTRRHSIIGL